MMQKLPQIYKVTRWALTVFILWHVWLNAHWSVAAALSLITFSIEGLAAAIQVHGKVYKAHIEGMRAAFQGSGEIRHEGSFGPIYKTNDEYKI